MKTIKLESPHTEPRAYNFLMGILLIGILLFARMVLNSPPEAVPMPTPALRQPTAQPIIVIQREAAPTAPPLPTWTPQPTPEPVVVYIESEPQVIYVQSEPQVVEVPVYVQSPPVNAQEPFSAPEAAPAVVELAAPTPAPAQACTTRQCNIQNRLANEHIQP